MIRRALAVLALSILSAPSYASDAGRVPDRLIIAFKESVQLQFAAEASGTVLSGNKELDDVSRRHKLREARPTSGPREYLFLFEKGVDLDRAIEDYRALKSIVAYVQADHILRPVIRSDVGRIQERLKTASLKMPAFDSAPRFAGPAGPVYAGTGDPRNSVTLLGGGGNIDATGKGSSSFGALYRRRVTPKAFDKVGNVGVEVGLVGTGSGGSYSVLEREVYRPYYGYEEVYEVTRQVPGTRAWEFAGVGFETRRLGPVSLEAGVRAVRYSDDPRYTVQERNYVNERVFRDCQDEHGRYYRCDYWETHNLSNRILEQGTGSTESGFGSTRYGAVNVRVSRKLDLRVEAGKTKAGRASGNSVRFGGRFSW